MTSSDILHAITKRTISVAVLAALAGSIPLTRAEVTPILEYRLGEDDSPNAIGSPATDPSKARTGGEDLARHGAPIYVAGNAAVNSTRAVRITNGPGIPPQFYSTEFDFNPMEASQWGFSCWVKFDALPDPDHSPEVTILHVGDINAGSIILQTMAQGGGLKFGTHAPGIAINVSEVEVQLGRWTHLAVVFDGTGRLYIDGVDAAAVGGGQDPPTGFTLGASRFTTGSFGSAGNLTLDDVRLFEVPIGMFTLEDLGVPPVTGPFVVGATGTPFGFSIEISDNVDATLDPASLKLKLNGAEITPTSVTKPSSTLVEYNRTPENPFPGGVYGIEIEFRDTAGKTYTDARSFRVRPYTLVPQSFAATGVNKNAPGFLIRPHQTTSEQPNSLRWTEDQLDGLHGANLASLDGATDGYFARDSFIDFMNETGVSGNFPYDASFAEVGIPGPTLATQDNMALEVLTYLEFPAAGFYTLGVNSDDGFRVTTGANARDKLGVVLGQYDGDRLAADSTFPIYVPKAGIYPFRLIYENGTGAASLEWFNVLEDGSKVLINDTATPGAILAYRTGPKPAYVSSVSPAPGQKDAPAVGSITVTITDGDTSVDEASVQMGLNGSVGAPTSVSKTAGVTTVTLTPPSRLPAGSTNTATLIYADASGTSRTNSWTFQVAEQVGGTVLITPAAVTQKAGDTLGGFPVANLINNSGFSTPPDAGSYATTTHDASGNTWVTATAANPNYFTAGHPAPQFILTLGSVFELSDLVVWGYGGNNNEATDFTVEFSMDSGVNFSGSESVRTSALLGGNAEALAFSSKYQANAVRITVTDNGGGRGFSGAGSGDRVGLGEIKFLGKAVVLVTPAGITQKAGDTLGDFPVANLINDSGFTTAPDAATYATAAHTAAGNTWVTATAANPNYFTAGHPAPQFVLTLGADYQLSHLVVWGYGGNNNEATDFTVEFSSDGGVTFAGSEAVQTSALLGGNAEALGFSTNYTANAVRITMTDNGGGRGFSGAGSGDRVGLGEIKFLAVPLATEPEPTTGPTLVIARTGGSIEISWPADSTGFVLESSDQLPGTSWSPVVGITNNRFTIAIGPGTQFYRLRKQ